MTTTTEYCPKCQRRRNAAMEQCWSWFHVDRLTAYHAGYGCDTGCCGILREAYRGDHRVDSDFDFLHEGEGNENAIRDILIAWARANGRTDPITIDVDMDDLGECDLSGGF